MNVSGEILYNKAFYVIYEQFPNAFPTLALNPRIFSTQKGEQQIAWTDCGRGMQLSCQRITYVSNPGQTIIDSAHPPKEIEATLIDGRVMTLRVLTCEVYYNIMLNVFKSKKFNTDEELQKFFETYDPVYESYKTMFG